MNQSESFKQYITDAEDNFQNGRFSDAHAHFSHISQEFFREEEIENAIYYSYRAIVCKQLTGPKVDIYQEIVKLGTFLLQFGLQHLEKEGNGEDDPWEAIKLLQLQYQVLKNIDYSSQLKTIAGMLIDLHKVILDESTLTIPERMSQYERLLELLDDTNNGKETRHYKDKLVNLLVTTADSIEDNEIDIYRKHQYYMQALNLCNDDTIREVITEKIDKAMVFISSI